MRRAASACLAGALLLVLGCANSSAPAAPTPQPAQAAQPAPTATSVPSSQPSPVASAAPSPATVASLAEDSGDVAASMLDSLADVIDEAGGMADSSCDELEAAQASNPNVFRSARGFAATMKNVIAQQPDLADDEEIKASLADLDLTMGELEGALRLCGITP